MTWFSHFFGQQAADDDEVEGEGDNLQEALDNYAEKVKALDSNTEITAIEIGQVDEEGRQTPWFSLKLR